MYYYNYCNYYCKCTYNVCVDHEYTMMYAIDKVETLFSATTYD